MLFFNFDRNIAKEEAFAVQIDRLCREIDQLGGVVPEYPPHRESRFRELLLELESVLTEFQQYREACSGRRTG